MTKGPNSDNNNAKKEANTSSFDDAIVNNQKETGKVRERERKREKSGKERGKKATQVGDSLLGIKRVPSYLRLESSAPDSTP